MNFQGNWVDLVAIVILIYFISEAWRLGFWILISDFLGFLLSLFVALAGYSFVGSVLETNFALPHSVANALGFFVAAGISESLFSFLFVKFVKKIPYRFWKSPWNNLAGIFPALGQGLILISFLVTLIVSLPISPLLKKDVSGSRIGGYLIQKTSGIEAKLNEVFGGLAEDSLTYLTVRQGSQELIPINYEIGELTEDSASEREMLNMINTERKKYGVPSLVLRVEVTPVARAHAKDMWERQYFSHYSPEGIDVGERLTVAGIGYQIAGENLALAPTLQTAHAGLMNSQGHRENILDPDFKRVGVGVIDNGIYGKMFVQVFTD